ncbi:MAG: cytidine deaminase [Woeseiaceae bacterium]
MSISGEQLVELALTARDSAYARYSNYAVGAALIDERGHVHTGCNVENASYPLGNCAETAAIAAMVNAGGRRIVAIAVVGGKGDVGACTPCGGCRQRIQEFADDDTTIIVHDDSEGWKTYTIAELLPASFHLI